MKSFVKRLISSRQNVQPEEPGLKHYGITVGVTLHAYSKEQAVELAEHLMVYGKLPDDAPVGAGLTQYFCIDKVIKL